MYTELLWLIVSWNFSLNRRDDSWFAALGRSCIHMTWSDRGAISLEVCYMCNCIHISLFLCFYWNPSSLFPSFWFVLLTWPTNRLSNTAFSKAFETHYSWITGFIEHTLCREENLWQWSMVYKVINLLVLT